MSNDLGNAFMREVMSLAASMLGSGTLAFSKDLSGIVLEVSELCFCKGA